MAPPILAHKNPADINAADKDGHTPLFRAVRERNHKRIQALVQAGADLNAVNKLNLSPLHEAVMRNDLAIVRMLLSHGAKPDAISSHVPSPLMLAVESGKNPAILKLLLDAGADVNRTDREGQGVTHYWAAHGERAGFEILRAAGVDFSVASRQDGTAAVHVAAVKGDVEKMTMLAAAGCNIFSPNKDGYTPLHAAAEMGHGPLADYLVQNIAQAGISGGLATQGQKRTALMLAVIKGKKDMVRKLLDAGCDVNARDSEGQTAIYHSVMQGDKEIFNILRRAGADIAKAEQRYLGYDTLLLKAARLKNKFMIAALVHAGVHLEDKNSLSQSPLMMAVEEYDFDLTRFLLDAGANPNVFARGNKRPIDIAIIDYRPKASARMLKTLIAGGADIHFGGVHAYFTPVHAAIGRDLEDVFDVFIKQPGCIGIRDKSTGYTPMLKAIASGRPEYIKKILKAGGSFADKDNDGRDALAVAIAHEEFEIADTLIAKGFDINAWNDKGAAPLMEAVESGSVARLEYVAGKTGRMDGRQEYMCDKNGQTLLHFAARQQDTEVFDRVLSISTDIDPNMGDQKGNTPMHLAAAKDNAGYLSIFEKLGGCLDRPNKDGITPLRVAIRVGAFEAVRCLVKKGCSVREVLENGESLCHLAAEKGDAAMLAFLIEQGAEYNSIDSAGNTPLHLAVMSGEKDCVDLLVERGVKLSGENKDGDTPLGLAEQFALEDIAKVLKTAMAKPGKNPSPKM